MKITKLEYQKKDPNRVNVYVDGKFTVGLDVNDIVKLGLCRGQEVGQEYLNKIVGESEFGKLFNKALNFLSYRPRSEWELRRKLRGEDPDLVERVVEKLKKIGQINDEAFAKWFVDQRNTFRPKGKVAIRQELRRMGVEVKIGDMGESEFSLAMRAVGKREFKERGKLERFLASRGFSWDTIRETVEKVLGKEYNSGN